VYKEFLKVLSFERDLAGWARAKENLGIALLTLGMRKTFGRTLLLEEAVAAYREALKGYARELSPFDWAMTQNSLGNALSALGGWNRRRRGGIKLLKEAMTAYEESLKEFTREFYPLEWAMVQNNIGITLTHLGMCEYNISLLHQAVLAYENALQESIEGVSIYGSDEYRNNLEWTRQALFYLEEKSREL
jgi:tetratricopeptide (TPR) repeat protein